MEFRPCIDIHNGKVKQIVGGSLLDVGNTAHENFVAEQEAAFFARLYKEVGIRGGHIILLNAGDSEYYPQTREQALRALGEYPGGLQVGGGITAENADMFLAAGASHVIVTSYVFHNGRIHYENLCRIRDAVGRDRLVLDLSCRRRGEDYYIVTDRWQKFTKERVTNSLLDELMGYCDEFLIHAVDVEGRSMGIEEDLAAMLGAWGKIPVTYAGGVGSFSDLDKLKILGEGQLNVTIGSALDLFGGPMAFEDVMEFMREEKKENSPGSFDSM
ncbi:MAG: phosphoribosylformimino-5-aminoimidazole carboxamide ribotide isomerase [Roseburia sp.]